MVPEARGLFSQVEALLRLLLVVPASSAEAERSFSALRRLKTWLRSSMSQTRLNSVAVCHVHRERMYNLDKKKLCQEFVQVTDRRMHVLGSFYNQQEFFLFKLLFLDNVHCFFLYLNCIACFILCK